MIKTYKPNDTARVEAMLFTEESKITAKEWAGRSVQLHESSLPDMVLTLEGWVDMPYGSYLIKGTNHEFYPCDPDVFEKRWTEI